MHSSIRMKKLGSLGLLVPITFSVSLTGHFYQQWLEWNCLQGLLPAVAFGMMVGSFDTKDLTCYWSCSLQYWWIVSWFSVFLPRLLVNRSVNIKFSKFVIHFFTIVVFERGFFSSAAPIIPLDSASAFCIDALFSVGFVQCIYFQFPLTPDFRGRYFLVTFLFPCSSCHSLEGAYKRL